MSTSQPSSGRDLTQVLDYGAADETGLLLRVPGKAAFEVVGRSGRHVCGCRVADHLSVSNDHGKRWSAVHKSSLNGTRHAAEPVSADGGVAILPGSEASRELLSLEMECGSRAPGVVRVALGQLSELGPARDDVILVASELVTNAVVHSGGSPGDTVQVRAALGRGRVSISVHDPGSSEGSPQLAGEDDLAAGGWGLRVVNELAHRWGFARDQGYRVWAELRLPPAARPGGG